MNDSSHTMKGKLNGSVQNKFNNEEFRVRVYIKHKPFGNSFK